MGRHKTTNFTDEERSKMFEEYIQPHMRLVAKIVYDMTDVSSNIDDNFQECCIDLLRYIDTYDPSNNVHTWIITNIRRKVGKLNANKQTYVDDNKGSMHQYVTTHEGYIKKYRSKKAKDFVNVYDDSPFVSPPDNMKCEGMDDNFLSIMKIILPDSDFKNGTNEEINNAIELVDNIDKKIFFDKFMNNEKNKDISKNRNVKPTYIREAIKRVEIEIKEKINR